ncbi:MAG: uroporphyrinogen-III synthase [Polaromonas sp.]
MTPRVIVTRPADDALIWVDQLNAAGCRAEALPLIEIGATTSPSRIDALHAAWQTLDAYSACLFVSGNAVEHFFKSNSPPAKGIIAYSAIENIANSGLRCLAPGPGTVTALRAAGVPAAQIDAPPPDAGQFDSQSLWQVIGERDWQGQRVLVVRGDSVTAESPDSPAATPGRDWIARQWTSAGAMVDFVSVYERRPPMLTPAQCQRARAASTDGSVWLFSSSEAVSHLVGHAALAGIDWGRARAVATHPRIAERVRQAGWTDVAQSRPALADITAAVAAVGVAGSAR